jgi:ATP-dependent 26S proteasome regulatory subunit
MKKSKKVSNQPAATALQNKPSIIEIDDVDDLKTERLNKTQPMADLKRFFITLDRVPGEDKVRMRCTLCE